MKNRSNVIIYIFLLGIWLLIANIIAIRILFKYKFIDKFQSGIIIYTIIASTSLYVIIFIYFMIMKVYRVDLGEKQKIIFITQFKKIEVEKKDIISKKSSFYRIYVIRIKHNGKVKKLCLQKNIENLITID